MEIYDGDNRFEIIAKAKEDLIYSTNIETSPDEMKVLDRFLFRCWQMDWLDKYDKKLEQPDKCKFYKDADCCYPIKDCNNCPNHKDNIFGIGVSDTEFRQFIIKYLLGKDWYVVDSLGQQQINEIALDEILKKYSKRYRKECKKADMESDTDE